MRITEGSRVRLAYELFNEKGQCVESSQEDGPLEFSLGAGEMPVALEAALIGKEAGDRLRLALEAEDAFGPYDPGGIVSVPRDEVPSEDLARGDWVPVQLVDDEAEDALEGEDDEAFEMRVVEVSDDEVILDANHPLAGQRVTFEVEVLAVESTGD